MTGSEAEPARPSLFRQIEARFASGRLAAWMLGVCLAVLCLRNLGGILAPSAALEDGRYLLAYFHNHPTIGAAWRFYGSYVSLGPNLIGYAVSRFPLTWQPGLLVAAPMALTAASYAILAHGAVRLPGLGGVGRVGLIVLILLAPIGNSSLFQVTAYSLWSMLLILSILTLFWRPKGWPGALIFLILGGIAIFSHPAALCLVPLFALRALMAEGWPTRVAFIGLLAATGLYLATGIAFGGASGGFDIGRMFLDVPRAIAERVVFETIFGGAVREVLLEAGLGGVMWLVSGAVLLAAAPFLWRTGRDRDCALAFLGLGYLIVAIVAFSAVTRPEYLFDADSQRYTYVPSILFLTMLVLALAPALAAKLAGIAPRGPVAALFVWGAAASLSQAPYYAVYKSEAEDLAAFLAGVETLQDSGQPYCEFLDRGAWFIRLAMPVDREDCGTD